MHAWLIERVIDVSYDKSTAGRETERSLESRCSILDVIRATARNDTVVFLARDKVAGLNDGITLPFVDGPAGASANCYLF